MLITSTTSQNFKSLWGIVCCRAICIVICYGGQISASESAFDILDRYRFKDQFILPFNFNFFFLHPFIWVFVKFTFNLDPKLLILKQNKFSLLSFVYFLEKSILILIRIEEIAFFDKIKHHLWERSMTAIFSCFWKWN